MKIKLTKREYFAAKAMQGLLADPGIIADPADLACHAVNCADALLDILEPSTIPIPFPEQNATPKTACTCDDGSPLKTCPIHKDFRP